MVCNACGMEVSREAKACPHCGNQTKKRPNEKNTETEDLVLEKTSHSMKEDMLIFVDDNQAFYKRKWDHMGDNRISWNIAALILFLLWFGYRKMYTNVFLLSLLLLALDVVGYTMFPYAYINTFEPYITFIIWVGAGMFGNRLYQLFTQKKVQTIRNVATNVREKNQLLKQKGGRSWIGMVIAVLIVVLTYGIPSTFIPLGDDPNLDEPEELPLADNTTKVTEIDWDTYENERFGFVVDYPATWEKGGEGGNGKGITFVAGKQSDVTVYAEPFDGSIERRETGVTEEVQTHDGHLAIVNRTEKDDTVTYHMSIVDDRMKYQLAASVTSTYAEKNDDVLKEVIRRFEIITSEEAFVPSDE